MRRQHIYYFRRQPGLVELVWASSANIARNLFRHGPSNDRAALVFPNLQVALGLTQEAIEKAIEAEWAETPALEIEASDL